MDRDALSDLSAWIQASDRKPLVVRGARQVGKTWLVREFARQAGRQLLEVNFERDPGDASLFLDRDPKVVVRRLEARLGKRVDPSRAILFLDEIQVAPQVFANLWWFAEDMPQLPVVAAGSLLDFVLQDHTFSMPVGRISYLHLEPMGFDEFLAAIGEESLRRYLETYSWGERIPEALHTQMLERYRDYTFVGGMPAPASIWARDRSMLPCTEAHHRLVATYRDDFHKYGKRVPVDRLTRVFDAVPRFLGQKFVYSRVSKDERSALIGNALDLLCKARVCTRVQATHGTGLPLGAEVRERFFKVIFVDTGLVSAALGLSFATVRSLDEIALVNGGAVLEQAVGQALRGLEPRFMQPALFYWAREQRGTEAELDYLIQHGPSIVPIKVKSGKTGTLKSLHLFMARRKLPLAVRFNADLPSITPVDVQTTTGFPAKYTLLSLPFYLASQLHRLIDDAAAGE